MDNKSLCLHLASLESEADVIKSLKTARFWDDKSCWRYFGDSEDNYSTIGNQQSKPEAALVEKLVNSVDALLISKCMDSGVDPKSSAAPKSIVEAQERYFGIRNGRLSNLDSMARTKIAENIYLVSTGAKSNPCYSIIDKGEGQTPSTMPTTILTLFKSIKSRIPFVQGKFHMGGTGAFRFCGQHKGQNNLQLVISKKKLSIAKIEKGDNFADFWGFTIVRREDPGNGRRSSVYTYLAPNNEILNFKAESLPLLPSTYPNKSGMPLYWGTYIKLYEYNMQGLKTNILFDLYNALSLLLPNIALPIRLCERRKGYTGHTFEATLSGLSVRLDEDRSENLEDGYPSSSTIVCSGQRMTALLYAFKRNQAEKYRRDEGIIFTVNGQTHGYLPTSFFQRQAVDMGYLKDSILIIVDCTEMDARSREELFMNSRDRLSMCPLRSEIESRLEKLVKEHPGLRQLREKRRKEEIDEKLQDSKPLVDVINQLLINSPSLSKLFVAGGKISNPFKLIEVGVGKPWVGKRYPTYFKLVNKSKVALSKNCPINWKFRVQYETDAENDYFDRDDNPGSFILKANGKIIDNYTLNLWNGKANVTASLPNNVKVADIIKYSSEMKDYTRVQPFTDSFIINVVKAKKHHKGGDVEGQENGIDPKGKGRFITSSLSVPNIIEIRRGEWEKRKFDEYSALDVVSTGEGGYDFFINMDNIHLLTELKYAKASIELLNARYKYGMVLIGMTLLQEPGVFKTDGEDASPGELIYERIRQFTMAISPLLLPMISSLGDLEVSD